MNAGSKAAHDPPSLAVDLGPLHLPNPVVMASGTFGFGLDYPGIVPPEEVGAIVTKGLSVEPWEGHAPPRVVESPAGLINAIGLENPGVDAFIERLLPQLAQRGARVIANVVGRTVDEYAEVAGRLDRAGGVVGLELNISCPNVKEGGAAFAVSPVTAARVVAAVRRRTALPLFVKIAPMGADPVGVAMACAAAGATGFTVANTYPALSIDVARRRIALSAGVGGLSGPAVRPLSVRLTASIYRATGMPIIGSGGIETGRDALEYIMAGARAVAVGTATFYRPSAALEIVRDLRGYLAEQGLRGLAPLVGAACGEPGKLLAPQQQAEADLERAGAVLCGHFRLSSGAHSDRYVEKFRLLERPEVAERLVRLLAIEVLALGVDVDVVVGPATGGILLAYELARQLGVSRAFFTERVEGHMRLRRGFSLDDDARVLLVEDVVTTGTSVLETWRAVEAARGRVVAMAALLDRSGGAFAPAVPYRPLVRVALTTYPPDACPLCSRGVPIEEPGSRRLS